MAFSHFTDYLQLEKNYSPHTIKAYERDLAEFSSFIQQEYSETDLRKVNYAMVRSWIISLADNAISNRTINRKIASLKGYYKFLLKTKQLAVSPLAKHKSLKVSKKVQVPFSKTEMDQVFTLFEENHFEGIRNKLIVELLYSTGIRRAELVNLNLNAVDESSNSIKVLGKRNKERIIPLLPMVLSTYKRYLVERDSLINIVDEEMLLLTKKGFKIYETLVYRIVNDYFSKVSAKVKKSPHIIRHSFATHLLNEGANLNAVKELLGHASLASTQVYTHNNIAELSKVYKIAHPRNKK